MVSLNMQYTRIGASGSPVRPTYARRWIRSPPFTGTGGPMIRPALLVVPSAPTRNCAPDGSAPEDAMELFDPTVYKCSYPRSEERRVGKGQDRGGTRHHRPGKVR